MLIRKKWNKKGMLGNLIGGFIVIVTMLIIFPIISQEINNALNCENNYIANTTEDITPDYEKPKGSTDSFGGGGSEQFGGYDGQVKHKDWLSEQAIIKTDKTYVLPQGMYCNNLISNSSQGTEAMAVTMLKMIPGFFALAVLGVVITVVWTSFSREGIM